MTAIMVSSRGMAILGDIGTPPPDVLYYPQDRKQLNAIYGKRTAGPRPREFRLTNAVGSIATYEELQAS